MVVQMAFNPARAVGFLHGHGHTQEQAQAVVEVVEDAREGLATNADLERLRLAMEAAMEAKLDLVSARLQNWMLKLMLAQTALFLTIAVGAIVVAGVLWG